MISLLWGVLGYKVIVRELGFFMYGGVSSRCSNL